jgi:hypothetical protein
MQRWWWSRARIFACKQPQQSSLCMWNFLQNRLRRWRGISITSDVLFMVCVARQFRIPSGFAHPFRSLRLEEHFDVCGSCGGLRLSANNQEMPENRRIANTCWSEDSACLHSMNFLRHNSPVHRWQIAALIMLHAASSRTESQVVVVVN